MKYTLHFIALCFLLLACSEPTKNEEKKKETKIEADNIEGNEVNRFASNPADEKYLGAWVGFFQMDVVAMEENKEEVVEVANVYPTENKINLSIDSLWEDRVVGHSVVAGNERPFAGTVKRADGVLNFVCKEPGDNKYDGEFAFSISNDTLVGKWAKFKKEGTTRRMYSLIKVVYNYNKELMLDIDNQFVNWEKYKTGFDKEYEQFWTQYEATTDAIFKINASNHLLTKEEVENLVKSDISIIRNTVYARHGYSFKKKAYRVFFDSQSWYIPVYADIKKDITDLEKKNIELLMKYEKNAEEFYDSFGR